MRRRSTSTSLVLVIALVLLGGSLSLSVARAAARDAPLRAGVGGAASPTNDSVVSNFSAAVDRLVTLVGAAGGGLLSLVWARVALSWFSHDSMKKVLAKERARDALVGTLVFVAAISGLVWALAHWVLTGG